MRYAVTFAVASVLSLVVSALARPSEVDVRARVALALAAASARAATDCRCIEGRPCDCLDCGCQPCGCLSCPGSDYLTMRARAVAVNKPLVVWVGQVCPACERELSECLHVRVKTFPRVEGAGVVVGVPERGDLYRRADLAGRPTAEQVRQVIRPSVARTAVPASSRPASYGPAFTPAFAPAMRSGC